jgi:hypothetical protein
MKWYQETSLYFIVCFTHLLEKERNPTSNKSGKTKFLDFEPSQWIGYFSIFINIIYFFDRFIF